MAGVKLLALGVAGTIAAYVAVDIGLGSLAVVLFASPAMVIVGLTMVLAPVTPRHASTDFGEWLDGLPRPRRLAMFAVGAVGLAIGVLLVLHLGDWSVDGVFDIVF